MALGIVSLYPIDLLFLNVHWFMCVTSQVAVSYLREEKCMCTHSSITKPK